MNNNEIDPVLFIWAALGLLLLLSALAAILLIREARKNARKHSMAMHPAGKGLVSPPVHPGWNAVRPLPVEPTRHIDRVGFDWTK